MNEYYTLVRLNYKDEQINFRLKTLSLPSKQRILEASGLEGQRLEDLKNDLLFMKFSNNNVAKEFMDKRFCFFSKSLTSDGDMPSFIMIFTIPD